jgi:hypothetical protein
LVLFPVGHVWFSKLSEPSLHWFDFNYYYWVVGSRLVKILALLWARLVTLSRFFGFGRSYAEYSPGIGLRLMLGTGLGSVLYLPLWIVETKTWVICNRGFSHCKKVYNWSKVQIYY